MPRVKKADLPKAPPIDILKALILERKNAYGYTWDDVADKANYSSETIRWYMSNRNSAGWSMDFKRAVCLALGMQVKTIIRLETGEEFDL